MTRRARMLIGTSAVAVVAFAAGPRGGVVEPDAAAVAARVPSLPADVGRWIDAGERGFDDIVPGAEKRVRWSGEPGVRTDLALVYFHGFSATRQEVRPVPERIADALGANLVEWRFTGHGRGGPAMADATTEAWLADAVEAVAAGHRLGRRVVILGVSTGSTLAAWYAVEHPDPDLLGAVLVSLNLGPRNQAAELLLLPWGRVVLPRLIPTREWEPVNDEQGRFWTTSYPSTALVPMMDLVAHVRSLDTSAARVPVLSVRSDDDPVVDPAQSDAWVASLPDGLGRVVPFDVRAGDDAHVLAGDILSPGGTDRVVSLAVDAVRAWTAR